MTVEQQIAQLKAENDALKAKLEVKTKLGMKVSEKGALSLYNLQRFPVTLRGSQWKRIFACQAEIVAFIDSHSEELIEK